MTKLISCFFALMLCNISFARIWRVNNSTGVTANFKTAQQAHDSAAVVNGDTIHLEPSSTTYGNLITTKSLVWISTGAFISIHPGEQASVNPGYVNLVNINTGSANSVFSINNAGDFNINTLSIRLERCYGNNVYINGIGDNNCVIINCFMTGNLTMYQGTNHIITNNIFCGFLYTGTPISATITNNVFNATSTGGGIVYNSTLQNNIFNKACTNTFNNCVVEYNMASATGPTLPAGFNNQSSVNMATVFNNNNGGTDTDFDLKVYVPVTTNPAVQTGTPAGTNMGAYGGTSPFHYAVVPAVPAIYKILAPAAPTGNTMSVIFSTKSNN